METTEAVIPTSEMQAGEEQEVITINGKLMEDESGSAPQWVRDVRKSNRDLTRRLSEVEAENKRLRSGNATEEVVTKPNRSDPDINFDDDKYDAKMSLWYESKQRGVDADSKKKASEQGRAAEWKKTQDKYEQSKVALGHSQYKEAEEAVEAVLSIEQQNALLKVARNPAGIVLALSLKPSELKRLGQETDPSTFAANLVMFEAENKDVAVRRQSSQTKPEGSVNGNASKSGDGQLDRLRAEANKTGDDSKVVAYRRSLNKN